MRDIDIRRALRREMDKIHLSDQDTLVVEEVSLCQGTARVDMAVVNGSLHGFEIKSEKDTLVRLAGQRDTYNACFEFVTIIASTKHLRNIMKIIPTWWGIWCAIEVDGEIVFHENRIAVRNVDALSSLALAQLLWRDEALDVLELHNFADGIRSKPRPVIWARLAASLEPTELAAHVRDKLKSRVAWRSA